MVLRLAGKHCAIVGATGIIGSSIAKAFAQEGAVISLLSRTATEARSKLKSELRPYKPPEITNPDDSEHIPAAHQFIPLDVSDHDNIKTVFGSCNPCKFTDGTAIGPLDILVNCAGISQTTLLKRTSDDEISRIVEINLLATMLVCKHARMRPKGCIINVSSLMANKGGLGASAYAASKAGVVGFTRALCREMASRSIRVNALLPGWVDSPMWTDLKPELQQAYLKDTPMNRVADPAELAEATVFLALNGFANNCILNLDGGLSAA